MSKTVDIKSLNGYALADEYARNKIAELQALEQCAYMWNLLDNSDFRNPVNQRGQTTYTGVEFTIDRWRTWSEGAVTIHEGYISHETAIYQTIAAKLDTTKKYTYAAMNTDNVITVVSGFITNDLWKNGMHLIYNEGKPYVRIEPEAHLKNVVWAALYEGEYTAETLPAYVPKGYAAELAECMRYYRASGVDDFALATLGAEKVFAVEHPGMRAVPSVKPVNPITGTKRTVSSYSTGGEFPATEVAASQDRTIFKVETGTPGNSYIYGYSISADL